MAQHSSEPLPCHCTVSVYTYLVCHNVQVHSISDVLSAMATTQNGRSGESTALGNLPQKSPKPAYLPQKSPKPAYLPQRSHSSAHQLPESPIPAHQNSHTSQKDCSAVTGEEAEPQFCVLRCYWPLVSLVSNSQTINTDSKLMSINTTVNNTH